MRTVDDIIALWPSAGALARELGLPYQTVAAWKARGSIPAAHWRALVSAAKRSGYYGVDLEALANMHDPAHREDGLREQAGAPPAASPAGAQDSGHFSRYRHLRRAHFSSPADAAAHIEALREEWSRR
jgi:hypothetical protein